MDKASFWARVSAPDSRGCMEWTGARDPDGYGRLNVKGRHFRAHRLAYELATGVAPGAMMVCHSCDNPACCNPAHLWLGDNRANQLDCNAKGRRRIVAKEGQDNGNARLSQEDAQRVVERIAAGAQNIEIATEFGVNHATISAIRMGKSWRGIDRPQNDNFKRYASLRA
jgi:hypothetical protein